MHVHAGGRSAGAGVVWLRSGLIVTNAHVATATGADIVLPDGRAHRARVVARDPRRDLAALAIAGDDRVAALRADARGLRAGELVVAVGHPLGVAYAAALGIVHRAPTGERGPAWMVAGGHPARAGQLGRATGRCRRAGRRHQRDDRGRTGDRRADARRRTIRARDRARARGAGGVIRVLVVARSELERAGLEALLAGRGHVAVGGGSATPADARRRIEDGSAQGVQVVLALLDAGAEPPRLALAPDAAARAPALVLLGDSLPRGWAVRAVRAGAQAVLPRTASADAIAAAVEAAAAGLVVLPPDALAEAMPGIAARAIAPPEPLSAREAQILALLAEGLVNKQIAARLGISRHTVKTHMAALFHKLGVSTRAEAVAAGARAGVILL